MAPIYEGSLRLECVRFIPPNTEIITDYAFSRSCFHPSGQCVSSKSPKKVFPPYNFLLKHYAWSFPSELPYHSDLCVKCSSCYRGIHSQCLSAEERCMEVTCSQCTAQILSKRRSLEFPDSQMYSPPLPSLIALWFFVFFPNDFLFFRRWVNLEKWKILAYHPENCLLLS